MKNMRIKRQAAALLVVGLVAPLGAMAQGDASKAVVSQCIGCHEIPGYKASFPSVYHVPKLYGQSTKYIESALVAYRKGERNHPAMRGIAGSLSDAEIANLAAYYGSK